MIRKIVLIVLDSAGVGALPDAEKYNDSGANTIGHIFESMGKDYTLPNMEKLGLYKIIGKSSSLKDSDIKGSYGKMVIKSPAKDTTAGHWEMMGIVLDKPFPLYPDGFPKSLIDEFEKRIGTKIIGNETASGTEIIQRLGEEHIRTGFPIVYTSADSVFQIAAHEETYGLEKLYRNCEIAREILTGENAVARVIARPFTGSGGKYTRTSNRKDYSLSPIDITVMDEIEKAGGEVIAIGKIEDIFNSKGITRAIHTKCNDEGMKVTFDEVSKTFEKQTLIFTNLVDFDMLWGHRRNVKAYANALREFDNFLPELEDQMGEEDMLIITADHGCDPTFTRHTDHTREYVPLMVYGKKLKSNIDLGIRESLSDIAASIADFFSLSKMKNGKSFKGAVSK